MVDRLVNIEIVGNERLQRMLEQLPTRTRNKILTRAFRGPLVEMRRQAMARAPVLQDPATLGSTSQGREPGKLRKGIKIRSRFSGRGRIAGGLFVADRSFFGIPAQSEWFYPAHVHYGHSVVLNQTGTRLTHARFGATALSPRTAYSRRKIEAALASRQAHKRVAPRPFMADVWEENKSRVERRVTNDVKNGIVKEARDLMWHSISAAIGIGS